jgi:hypothetical protein
MFDGSWMADTWNGYGQYFNVMGDLKFEGRFIDGRASQRAQKKVVRALRTHNNVEEISFIPAPAPTRPL